MWLFSTPDADRIAAFLELQQSLPVSYPEVGHSLDRSPAGYNIDHNRVMLGRGEEVFEKACAALRSWTMFPAPWTRIDPPNAPIVAGQTVAMLAQVYGLWWLNACRIVYVIDETAPVQRFGFAYGTLPGHVEKGEERFTVERLADDTVWYDLRAFSRPRFWLVRLAKPLARGLQRRFATESKLAMQHAVGDASAR